MLFTSPHVIGCRAQPYKIRCQQGFLLKPTQFLYEDHDKGQSSTSCASNAVIFLALFTALFLFQKFACHCVPNKKFIFKHLLS